jgi:hypothetical protein
VSYQHPLGYLLGLEGLALLRAFKGEHGRDFTLARFAEIRALLDDLDQAGEPAESRPRFSPLDPAEAPPPSRTQPDHPSDIWTLRPWCPAAFRAAYSGSPLMIFWKFQRAAS